MIVFCIINTISKIDRAEVMTSIYVKSSKIVIFIPPRFFPTELHSASFSLMVMGAGCLFMALSKSGLGIQEWDLPPNSLM